jgi:hypothetical protein
MGELLVAKLEDRILRQRGDRTIGKNDLHEQFPNLGTAKVECGFRQKG